MSVESSEIEGSALRRREVDEEEVPRQGKRRVSGCGRGEAGEANGSDFSGGL